MGSIWIEKEFWNDTWDRPYTGGDTLWCFFAILIGLASLGATSNHFKAITEGRVAGKLAFEVIDRVPTIDQDDGEGAKHQLKGEIEFRDVSFYYPTRPDMQVLKNFSCKFKLGETTAIVGPSGSGKSTIVQLIERFYEPSAGEILIDGVPLNTLNLRDLRK